MRIKRFERKIKCFSYHCSSCGKNISSYEYYTYGKCNNCRFL